MLALLLIEDPPSVKRFAVPRCSVETILILQVPIDRTFRSADSDHITPQSVVKEYLGAIVLGHRVINGTPSTY